MPRPQTRSQPPLQLTVIGNCQAESLRLLLGHDDVTSVRTPAVHELTPALLPALDELLARTDLLVVQPIGDDYRGLPVGTRQLVERLPRGAAHVVVPSLRYAGLHPWHLLVHPPGVEAPDPPVLPYHDVRTVAAAAWARLGEPAPPAPALTEAAVAAVAAESVAELRRREVEHATVRVSDLFAHPTDDTMRTINHPGNAVLAPVVARIRERLGLAARGPALTRPLLAGVLAPLEPAVVAHHRLAAAPRRDWAVTGRTVSEEEVAHAHLRWYAERPAMLDAAVARSARTAQLLGVRLPEADRWSSGDEPRRGAHVETTEGGQGPDLAAAGRVGGAA